ncbi:Subunit of tRNA-specific adenosine-34 deaminase [Plasmopara halstedii]|uniref:Subunit of tRNA-specific adenosine-34 deaminase n=1 Tax=Plasmopara halstedii TaxID=4781 RepID=A0A0P1ARF6_PLAHL|nr:Subunit of tRNA-specific adenosine-34 deaminase [Plasmopara halstedii]CEG44136.1 Subunit of tRNA-specific adenosine-34 deaminase [Plasmopara halstedii]|eukprot:XP_024580505.1 Subunit of tRNA-specific adenosine-34 deaminase [Plasmopara halstedii]
MKLVEVVEADDGDQEAQQLFVALEFPAHFGTKVINHLSIQFQSLVELGFTHLKRLKKHPELAKTLIALVCPISSNDNAVGTSTKELRELEMIFEAKLTTAEALKRPPRTRELYEKYTQLWPLIFHASVEESVTTAPIGEEETNQMEKLLRVAVKIGTTLEEDRQEVLKCAWGCVVVNPAANELITSSKTVGIVEMLYHPVMVAINRVAERDRRRDSEARKDTEHKKLKRREKEDLILTTTENTTITKQSDSYLCTGYDVYVDHEPCAMCAMALVHSRVRRVVFDRANPSDGVLMSSIKLHTIKSLNHHYRVFHMPLSIEVIQGCKE